ncbi:MAG: MotA/TolQ/ExbB proton channel family protein [Zoogloeaceae bacterium]|jgi:biopolymer transport protein ExbB|nr:MotA/TolQ/ExbB proton channel family protein [Zoogloeaceae bacterium]
MPESFGFAHFLSRADAVGIFVLLVLVTMSLLSWYLMLVKFWQNSVLRNRSKVFLAAFHRLRNREDARRLWMQERMNHPFARLLEEGVLANQLVKAAAREVSNTTTNAADDFISASLQRGIARESRNLETGMTSLASIASCAPFVGLFGTVWGIYHALLGIGFSGQASLDQVAGPVGEALIMTACGLGVAIPALLAYNALTRMNRHFIGEMESYAHDVFSIFCFDRLTSSQHRARRLQAAPQPENVIPHVAGAC